MHREEEVEIVLQGVDIRRLAVRIRNDTFLHERFGYHIAYMLQRDALTLEDLHRFRHHVDGTIELAPSKPLFPGRIVIAVLFRKIHTSIVAYFS